EEEVDILVKKIRCSCLEGKPVNLSEMLVNVTNNIIFRTIVGQRNEEEEEDDALTGVTLRLKRTYKEIDAFFELVIKEHKNKMLTTLGGQSNKKNFVEILLQLQEDGMLDFDLNQDSIKAILL
ncbi:cytochrome p450 71a1, partial [Fagus crenata]